MTVHLRRDPARVGRGGDAVTLAEFLLARIAEDEDPALFIEEMEAKYPRPPDQWITEWAWVRFTAPIEYPRNRSTGFEQGAPSPARVLAECKAKRRIVEHALAQRDPAVHDEYRDVILPLLALPYADHPEFDEAWTL